MLNEVKCLLLVSGEAKSAVSSWACKWPFFDLMVCRLRLKILNNFISEFVFCKRSRMERVQRAWVLCSHVVLPPGLPGLDS